MTKIMLVEDDNNLREIYEARLSAEGYEIVSAQDGEAALAIAAKEHPDMIISDVMMPKISGFEMLDILRNTASLSNVKIIMLTALGQVEDSARASSLGADRYLVKSQVTLEDIVKATHELLDGPQAAAPAAAGAPTADDAADQSVAVSEESAAPTAAPEPVAAFEPTPAPEPVTSIPVSEPADATTVDEAPSLPVAEPADPVVIPEPDTQNEAEPEAQSEIKEPALEIPEPAIQAEGPAPEPEASPAEVAEPAPEVVPTPQAEPVTPPAAPRSIPVQVFSDDAVPTPEPVATPEPELHPISNLPVMPEPPALEVVPAPEPEASQTQVAATTESQDTPVEDYTSPASFNKFQAEPNTPIETPDPSPDVELQTTTEAEAESEMKAQIDDFINSADSSDEVPPAEDLDIVAPPVISAPENISVPEPTPTPIQTETETVTDTNSNDDDALIASAANDLIDTSSESNDDASQDGTPAESVTQTESTDSNDSVAPAPADASEPSTANKMRTISPIPSPESKPSIHQLLELEEAKASATQASYAQPPTMPVTPGPNIDAYNPSTNANQQPLATPPPEADDDPNAISL